MSKLQPNCFPTNVSHKQQYSQASDDKWEVEYFASMHIIIQVGGKKLTKFSLSWKDFFCVDRTITPIFKSLDRHSKTRIAYIYHF